MLIVFNIIIQTGARGGGGGVREGGRGEREGERDWLHYQLSIREAGC